MRITPPHADPREAAPTVALHPGALVIDLMQPRRVLSSAPFGGGLVMSRYLVNSTVPGDFDGDVDTTIHAVLDRHGLAGKAVTCALTAVKVEHYRHARAVEEDVCATVYVTAGLSNLAAPGLSPLVPALPGTINVFALVAADLPDAALVETVQIITEVKARRLAGRLTPDGHPATGTSTDTVTVALLPGPSHAYAGAVTPVGRALARACDAALMLALPS
ncbi:MAG: adenosylcobinamide amidohydrolase [Rhodocyclales bacterium]|nr:adenosylcobinamide amidohydrolase [Rhodocyclales bacterium]